MWLRINTVGYNRIICRCCFSDYTCVKHFYPKSFQEHILLKGLPHQARCGPRCGRQGGLRCAANGKNQSITYDFNETGHTKGERTASPGAVAASGFDEIALGAIRGGAVSGSCNC